MPSGNCTYALQQRPHNSKGREHWHFKCILLRSQLTKIQNIFDLTFSGSWVHYSAALSFCNVRVDVCSVGCGGPLPRFTAMADWLLQLDELRRLPPGEERAAVGGLLYERIGCLPVRYPTRIFSAQMLGRNRTNRPRQCRWSSPFVLLLFRFVLLLLFLVVALVWNTFKIECGRGGRFGKNSNIFKSLMKREGFSR